MRTRKLLWFLTVLLISVLVLSACGGETPTDEVSIQPVEPTEEPVEQPPEEPEAEEPVEEPEEPEEVKTRKFTFDAMQALGISAVIADIQYEEGNYANVPLGSEDELISSENPPPSEVKVQAFLLVVNPQDALVLKHLLDMGGVFDFVLRAPTSDQLFNLQPVMSEYLIDRYQLEIPR